jgi:hypothetical protein
LRLQDENAQLRAWFWSLLTWISERDELWCLAETEIAVRWPADTTVGW